MAKFAKRTQEPNAEVEIEDSEILLPGEEPTANSTPENGSDDTPREETEMTETATPEIVIENDEKSLTERLNEEGFAVTEAAANLLAEVEGNAIQLLDIESLPKDAKVVKMQLTILSELADEYKELHKELAEGTSGKDEKIASYVANLDESGDENGIALRDLFAELREAREEAMRKADEAEAAFMAHVESELSAKGGGVMSEEDIKAKTAEIKMKFGEYAEQHKAAKSFLDNYRQHKNADVGEIHQYVTHIDRPSGRATSGTRNASAGGQTASRSVHVSGAFFSRDNGATWNHSTTTKTDASGKSITLSNPASLAIDLGKAFSTTVAKDDIVDAWYSAAGQTRETASKANMPNEISFEFAFKDGSGNEVRPLVKLAKRQ